MHRICSALTSDVLTIGDTGSWGQRAMQQLQDLAVAVTYVDDMPTGPDTTQQDGTVVHDPGGPTSPSTRRPDD